jgi:hypothetical protein
MGDPMGVRLADMTDAMTPEGETRRPTAMAATALARER